MPLFTYVHPGAAGLPAQAETFKIPHWMLVSFTDPPPTSPQMPCHLTQAPAQGTAPASTAFGALVMPRGIPPLQNQVSCAATLRSAPPHSPRLCGESFGALSTSLLMHGVATTVSGHRDGGGRTRDPDDTDHDSETKRCAQSPSDGSTCSCEARADASPPDGTLGAPRKSVRLHGDAADSQKCENRPDANSSAPQEIPRRHARCSGRSPVSSPPVTEMLADHSSSGGSHDDEPPHSHTGPHRFASMLGTSPTQLPSSLAQALQPYSRRATNDTGAHMIAQPRLSGTNVSSGSTPAANVRGMACGVGSSRAASVAARPRSGGLNPFSFHVAADAQALKNMANNSYARRRWLHVNQISEQADHDEGELPQAVYSNSSVLQQLEHQWTSLSEPAVLPLTTDPTSEHLQVCPPCAPPRPKLPRTPERDEADAATVSVQVMQTQQSAESSWWRLDVPRQEEVRAILAFHCTGTHATRTHPTRNLQLCNALVLCVYHTHVVCDSY